MVVVCSDETFIDQFGKPQNGYMIDDTLYSNFVKYYLPRIENDFDAWCLISGGEGSAKTTLTASLAHFCDRSFIGDEAINRTCFTFNQLMYAIDNSPPGKAIVLDEAVITLMSQDASSNFQKTLIKKAVTMRKKKLFIFLIIPSMFLLRQELAIRRTLFLIHTYTNEGFKRGQFKFYGYQSKKMLHLLGKKYLNMNAVRPDFYGRFSNTYGFFWDPVKYEKKKDKAILELTQQENNDKKEADNLKYQIMRNQRDLILFQLQQEISRANTKPCTMPILSDYLFNNTGIQASSATVSTWVKNARQINTTKLELMNLNPAYR